MTILLYWFYSLELYQAMALALGSSFLMFFAVAFTVLEYKESKLRKEEQRLFADDDGIPNFVRATDEQIGLHNQ